MPSWEKLAITALLIIFFLPFITYDNGTRCIQAPCPSTDTGTAFSWLFRHGLPLPPPQAYSLDFRLLRGGIAICYIAACALAYFLPRMLATQDQKKKFAEEKHAPVIEQIAFSYKEFLRPTLAKIEISLVLFLLMAPLLSYGNGKICPPCPIGQTCPTCRATSVAPYMEVPFHPERTYQMVGIDDAAFVAFFVPFSYLFGCMLVSKIEPFFAKKGKTK